MANRRMFSNRIANSARFLQMPAESQLLYFHMVLRADDDGIVEAYPLIRLLGMAPDNFKVLLAKGFIKQLNEDQVIVIKDWLEHNTIRADRKIDSIYKHLLLEVAPEIEIVKPKPRSDVEDNSKRLSGGQSTDGISKVRLGKVKLSKDNLIISNASVAVRKDQDIFDILNAFKPVNPSYQKFFANTVQRTACTRMIKSHGLNTVLRAVAILPKSNEMPYMPVITTPLKLEDKWADLVAGMKREKQKNEDEKPKVITIK